MLKLSFVAHSSFLITALVLIVLSALHVIV